MSDVVESSAAGVRPSLSEKVQSLRLRREPVRAPFPWFPWTLCLILAVTTGVLAVRPRALAFIPGLVPPPVSETSESEAPRNTATPTAAPPKPEVPAPGTVALEAKGYIIPAHQILVSPKVSGMIVTLNFEEGKRVQKGDVLAQLETTDYESDYKRAAALLEVAKQRSEERENGWRPEEIEQAKAELDEAIAQKSQLESDLERARKLRSNNTISKSDFEEKESSYKAMDRKVARLRANHAMMVSGERIERKLLARAEVQLAEADLAKAKWKLDNCTIRAPISGTILKKNAEEGNIVNPVAFNGSFSLCDMADLSDLEVELNIQERDVAQVRQGQRCIVRSEAYPDRKYEGRVSRLMPIADRSKAAIPVRVKLTVPADEEGVYLKPEMGAIVSFQNDEKKPD